MAQADTPTDEQAPESTAETPPPIHGRLSNSGPTDDFAEFVERKRQEYKGRDGHGEEKDYIPTSELSSYWTMSRIRDACESYSEGMNVSHDLIRDRYLRVFSTLVFIGELSYLPAFQRHRFWDDRFPDTTLPGVWEQLPSYTFMFEKFKKHQWMFFPAILDRYGLDDTLLPLDRILPIYVEDTIREQLYYDRAAIKKVRFHPSCNNLVRSDGTADTNPSYILKTYHGEHHEQHYQYEVRAFRLLRNAEHVVRCHATFKHGETYNLVIEWVAGGDLLQYFQNKSPPQTSEDIIDFWDSLLKVSIGLDRIHQIIFRGERSDQYQLVHQDIKPDNILLDIPLASKPYQFFPIITDLGHSHMRHVKPNYPDMPAVDRRGNQMYCAPESSHHAGHRRTGPNGIKWDADVFSAGAVFSDAASWVSKGKEGREEYFRRRQKELRSTKGFADSGYETAFHNGSERLPSVDAMHHDIRSNRPPHDKMTSRVLDIIENHMMVLPSSRLQARLLCGKFDKEIQDAKAEAVEELFGLEQSQPARSIDISNLHDALPEPETPPASGRPERIWTPPPSATLSISTDGYPDSQDTFSPTRPPSTPKQIAVMGASNIFLGAGAVSPTLKRPKDKLKRPFTSPNQPLSVEPITRASENNTLRSVSETNSLLSMQDAAEYRRAIKNRERVNPEVERVIKKLISNLETRDHLFFIDDTDSMKEHSTEIEECFQTLAYIAKSIDPDCLELSFVSRPFPVIKNRRTRILVNELREHLINYVAVTGRIESSLSTLIKERIKKRLPFSLPFVGNVPRSKPITIFVFTDGKWGERVQPGTGLTEPISNLMREMKNRGLNRTHVMFQFLRFGDDEEGMRHLAYLDNFGKKEKWDIVDTRDIDGDVYSMFLATLTEHNDINNEGSPTSDA